MYRTRTLAATTLATLVLAACGGGGSSDSSSPAPANDGLPLIVTDATDSRCTGLIRAATELYGAPTVRDEILTAVLGGGIDQQIRGWEGIGVVMSFRYGRDVQGCEAEYGALPEGVPAIDPPGGGAVAAPAPSSPRPAQPPAGTGEPVGIDEPVTIPGDEQCTRALEAVASEQGTPSASVPIDPVFAADSTSLRHEWGSLGLGLVVEYGPSIDGCVATIVLLGA